MGIENKKEGKKRLTIKPGRPSERSYKQYKNCFVYFFPFLIKYLFTLEFYELMDGPTIKTNNLYSFSPLIELVFETVIAMLRLQPEPHF